MRVLHHAVDVVQLPVDELLDLELGQPTVVFPYEPVESGDVVQQVDLAGTGAEPRLDDHALVLVQQRQRRLPGERSEVRYRDAVVAQVLLHQHLVAEEQRLLDALTGDAQFFAQFGGGQQEAFGDRHQAGRGPAAPAVLEADRVGERRGLDTGHPDDGRQFVTHGLTGPLQCGDQPYLPAVRGQEGAAVRASVRGIAEAVEQNDRLLFLLWRRRIPDDLRCHCTTFFGSLPCRVDRLPGSRLPAVGTTLSKQRGPGYVPGARRTLVDVRYRRRPGVRRLLCG